jgi:hypothetical protein
MDSLGKSTTTAIDNSLLDTDGSSGKYLYLVAGVKTTKRASCTITMGTDGEVANLVSGMNAIQLLDAADGITPIKLVFDSTKGWDQAFQAGKIHIGGTGATPAAANALDNAKKLAYAISTAIEGTTGFTTNAASRNNSGAAAASNETTIVVTRNQTNPTATENTANTLVDAYTASGITITDFSGGLPNSITDGKLLIRITGFVAFDDV